MTSAAGPTAQVRADLGTIVGGGAKLGLMTTVGVVAFALLSRTLDGAVETGLQCLLILIGGLVFSYLPAIWVRPKDVDSIAWAALIGLLGALVFTVLDTAILRPVNLYHWSWDEIGGGSGFWYIPVWWMGSATLAWLGAWTYSSVRGAGGVSILAVGGPTVMVAIVAFFAIGLAGAGFSAAVFALGFVAALLLRLGSALVSRRQ